MAKRVLVDFDGVLAQYDGWKGPQHLGDPILGAQEAMQVLAENFELVCFTTRDPESVEEWLKRNSFPVMQVTDTKLPAVVLIDDRVIEFRGEWSVQLLDRISNFRTYWEPGAAQFRTMSPPTNFDALAHLVSISPAMLARRFHELYQQMAPSAGYETRPESRVPYDQLKSQLRLLMETVCAHLMYSMRLPDVVDGVNNLFQEVNLYENETKRWAEKVEKLEAELQALKGAKDGEKEG